MIYSRLMSEVTQGIDKGDEDSSDYILRLQEFSYYVDRMGNIPPRILREVEPKITAFRKKVRLDPLFVPELLTLIYETSSTLSKDKQTPDGVIHRNFMHEVLAEILRNEASSGELTGLLLIDLDRFKKYNDEGSYILGDHLASAILNRLSNSFKSRDRIGIIKDEADQQSELSRYGGDEIVICTIGGKGFDARERVRDAIESTPYTVRSEDSLTPTSTIKVGDEIFLKVSIGYVNGDVCREIWYRYMRPITQANIALISLLYRWGEYKSNREVFKSTQRRLEGMFYELENILYIENMDNQGDATDKSTLQEEYLKIKEDTADMLQHIRMLTFSKIQPHKETVRMLENRIYLESERILRIMTTRAQKEVYNLIFKLLTDQVHQEKETKRANQNTADRI